ncbi:MAG: DEAD/DEAH box helicase [Planctomycetes bacterium]|nr:DEAD/DEAH box helicase [Planctomycetota bacterium]
MSHPRSSSNRNSGNSNHAHRSGKPSHPKAHGHSHGKPQHRSGGHQGNHQGNRSDGSTRSHGSHETQKSHSPSRDSYGGNGHSANRLIARGGPDDVIQAHIAVNTPKIPDAKLFSELNLSAPVLRALNEEGYTTPTPIQAQAIPSAMAGHDLLGCAQTGTGKTAAFALPILHLLTSTPADKTHRGPYLPRVLVLSPTRELATQIGESFQAYGRHTGLRGVCIFGGVSQGRQVRALRDGIDILVATPGRLIDLIEQGHVDLSQIKIMVLDEADRMLDMGFIAPIRRIVSLLSPNRQTMMFSATMPREIMKLADSLLKNPVKVAVTPVASAAPMIEQSLYMVNKFMKPALLEHILQEAKVTRAVVFTKTKHGADKLAKVLNRSGISSVAIHGNKAQNQRERALDGFRSGRSRILVATDVAARGLDVDGITHVFNFDLPMEPEAYVHRIGRTGRAGAKGIAISFCDGAERGLMRDIERVTGKRFNAITQLPALPEPVPPTAEEREADRRAFEERNNFHGNGGGRSHASRPGWNRPRNDGGQRSDSQGHGYNGAPNSGGGSGSGHRGGGKPFRSVRGTHSRPQGR